MGQDVRRCAASGVSGELNLVRIAAPADLNRIDLTSLEPVLLEVTR